MAKDLKDAFPEMSGFSPRNIKYMSKFAESWPDFEIVQRVVIELKACDFEPGIISQLNMYQNVVDDILRHPDDKPTIGLLLVKGKNKTVVEYSLAGYQNPIDVAEWKNQMAVF